MSLYNLENRVNNALASGPYDKPGVAKDVASILTGLVKSADKDVADAEKRLADAKTHRAAVSALMAGVTGDSATRRTNDALLAQLKSTPAYPVKSCDKPERHGEHTWNRGGLFRCPGRVTDLEGRECGLLEVHVPHIWESGRDDGPFVKVMCPGVAAMKCANVKAHAGHTWTELVSDSKVRCPGLTEDDEAPTIQCPHGEAHRPHSWESTIGVTREDLDPVTVWCPGVKSPN